MTEILSISNLTVNYEGHKMSALKKLSLNVCEGEKIALLGLNGSGKTTLLFAIAGLLPHEGNINVMGLSLTKENEEKIRSNIGFLFSVPDNQILFPKVIDDVSFGLLRKGMKNKEASETASALMEKFGIGHLAEDSPYHLSHGERQRVALAGAVIGKPNLLLLDEPSSGLDPVGRESLCALLKSLDSSMMIATHDADFVKNICDRFIVLEKGSIVRDSRNAVDATNYWQTKNEMVESI